MSLEEAKIAFAAAVARLDEVRQHITAENLPHYMKRAEQLHASALALLGRYDATVADLRHKQDYHIDVAVATGLATSHLPQASDTTTLGLKNAQDLVAATRRKLQSLRSERKHLDRLLQDAATGVEQARHGISAAVAIDAADKIVRLRSELENAQESLLGLLSLVPAVEQHSVIREALDASPIDTSRVAAHADAWPARLEVLEVEAVKMRPQPA